jgi:hypothetical protein
MLATANKNERKNEMNYLTEAQHNLVMEALLKVRADLPDSHEALFDLNTAIGRIDELAIELGFSEVA